MKKSIIYMILLAVVAGAIIIFAIRMSGGDKKTETMKNGKTAAQGSPSGEWRQISPQDIADNAVTLFRDDWMALAAGKQGEEMNAMTIAWGGIGVLWGKPVVTVYVSPDRYTHTFMEKYDHFTVTAFTEEHKPKLVYIGSHSGRDGDKIKEAGLTVEYTPLGNPTFTDGRLMIECRKIYSQQFDSARMNDTTKAIYSKGMGVHHIYIGEIVNVWVK